LSNSINATSTTLSSDAIAEEQGSTSVPSYRRLAVFIATTILIWISEPLLSLVDTTIVGMTAKNSVVQIAALGPATTLYDSAIYLTYFLAIATTNLISPALAKKDYAHLRRSTSHLMGLAVVFGGLVSLVNFGMGRMILGRMVGNAGGEILELALRYAWIRAAVAPFCVVDFVAQSFCLTNLDTKTPAIAVVVASLVNLVGDWILSPRYGIQGAAVATAMATVSSCLILLRKVKKTTQEWKDLQYSTEPSNPPSRRNFKTAADNEEPPIQTQVVNGSIEIVERTNNEKPKRKKNLKNKINGASSTKVEDVPFWSLPDRKSLVELLGLAGPIFFVMMAKICCYSAMTVRATSFGIVPLATHSIVSRVFFFFACFGDSLSQATQTFFPQVAKIEKTKLLKRLLLMSTFVGLMISQAGNFILSHLGGYLTKDAAIIQLMAKYSPYISSAILLHPFIMFAEGTVLARRDLKYLVGMYISTMILHFSLVASPLSQTFKGLWQVFFGFQAIRVVQFAGRVIWNTKQDAKENAVSTTAAAVPSS